MSVNVAVYGSLKKGYHNNHVLGDSELIGFGITPPSFTMLDLSAYPGLVAGTEAIHVEVYKVDSATLQRLDYLEGHPTFYRREEIPVYLLSGNEVIAFVYSLSSSTIDCEDNSIVHRINEFTGGVSW